MYKVFFKDRIVFLDKDFPELIKKNEGLFYKFGDENSLKEIFSTFRNSDSLPEFYIIHDDIDMIWNIFKKMFKMIRAGGGVVRNQKGEVLVIKRSGLWDLPKGKQEKEEKIEDTALREVSEECGIENPVIDSELIKTYHTYILEGELVLKETTWFSMKYNGEKKLKPQTEEGITCAVWVPPSEISYISGNTYKSLLEVFRVAGFIH